MTVLAHVHIRRADRARLDATPHYVAINIGADHQVCLMFEPEDRERAERIAAAINYSEAELPT